MFEKKLEADLKAIFAMNLVSFGAPSDAKEQEKIFVQIETYNGKFESGPDGQFERGTAKGKLIFFANSEKLPFGYLSKQIEKADPELKKPFYFHQFEENTTLYQNIVQRSVAFVYFYREQYNPTDDTIEEINFTETIT